MRYPKLSPRKAALAYRKFGSIRKAAHFLHVAQQTVHKYLRASGERRAPGGGGYRKGRRAPYVETSRIAAWYHRHRDVAGKLRSASKIAFAAGTTVNAVKCFLYRNRRYETQRARALLGGFPGTWTLDPYTFEVVLQYGSEELHTTTEEIEHAVAILQDQADRQGASRAK